MAKQKRGANNVLSAIDALEDAESLTMIVDRATAKRTRILSSAIAEARNRLHTLLALAGPQRGTGAVPGKRRGRPSAKPTSPAPGAGGGLPRASKHNVAIFKAIKGDKALKVDQKKDASRYAAANKLRKGGFLELGENGYTAGSRFGELDQHFSK